MGLVTLVRLVLKCWTWPKIQCPSRPRYRTHLGPARLLGLEGQMQHTFH
uniref:Uncharacterized protein n=1 Tax=Arundo donax TaxID=35708 RepID=A0A0A9AVJ6_ARUDO